MRLKVLIDVAGWHHNGVADSTVWQSITGDEMKLTAWQPQTQVPPLSDLDAVRRYFRDLVRSRHGALISCDGITNVEPAMVRVVSKYPAGRGQAVTFVASLAVPLPGVLVELLITGSEDNVTGVREALVIEKLLENASPSFHQQLAGNVIPMEWKFERYEPGTRQDCAYVVSDDTQYDEVFPNHPLTRVRRWLRRNESSFRVKVQGPPPEMGLIRKLGRRFAKQEQEPKEYEIEIEVLPLKPMTFPELIRELGPQVASDAMTQEALKQLAQKDEHRGMQFPSLETRQRVFRDQRDEELRKLVQQQQHAKARMKSVRENGEKLFSQSTASDAKLIAARNRDTGRWLITQEGASRSLVLFTTAVFFQDYASCKGLALAAVAMTIQEVFSTLPEFKSIGVDSLSIDRCPRCSNLHQVYPLAQLLDATAVLRFYAFHLASQRFLVDEKFQEALRGPGPQKRIAGLKYILEHVDPAAESVRQELAKLTGT